MKMEKIKLKEVTADDIKKALENLIQMIAIKAIDVGKRIQEHRRHFEIKDWRRRGAFEAKFVS